MRSKSLNWFVVGVGLVAACAIAGQLATAQNSFDDESPRPAKVKPSESSQRPGRAFGNRRIQPTVNPATWRKIGTLE